MEKNIISTQEISTEPVKKKRRTVFEFIKEQQLQLEADANFSPVKTEFDLFFKEMVVETKDVFSWWNENKFRYPNIFQFVKKYLILPATSVSSERVFSKAGEIILAKRNRLSRKRANELIFLNMNKNLFLLK